MHDARRAGAWFQWAALCPSSELQRDTSGPPGEPMPLIDARSQAASSPRESRHIRISANEGRQRPPSASGLACNARISLCVPSRQMCSLLRPGGQATACSQPTEEYKTTELPALPPPSASLPSPRRGVRIPGSTSDSIIPSVHQLSSVSSVASAAHRSNGPSYPSPRGPSCRNGCPRRPLLGRPL